MNKWSEEKLTVVCIISIIFTFALSAAVGNLMSAAYGLFALAGICFVALSIVLTTWVND